MSRNAPGSGETVSVSIGQGAVAVTPMSLAMFAATVANGGTRVTPQAMGLAASVGAATLRVARRPVRVVGRARPAHHPLVHREGDDRHQDHADRLALDVGERVQADLPPLVGRGVSQAPGGERVARLVELDDQVEACRRIFASDRRWTVVRGSDLEEGESEGLPVWSRHVGDPILESNITRRVDYALFMVEALKTDALIRETLTGAITRLGHECESGSPDAVVLRELPDVLVDLLAAQRNDRRALVKLRLKKRPLRPELQLPG